MRVALLNPYSWPEVRRGSERVIRDVAAALVRDGHEAWIVAGTRGTSGTRIEDGVHVTRNRALRSLDAAMGRLGYGEPLGHAPGALRALHRIRPDVAHAFYSTDGLAALAWARVSGAPLVFSAMGLPMREAVTAKRGRRLAWRALARRADQFVVLSEAARAAVAWLRSDARVITPGVDLDAFKRSRAMAPLPTVLCPAAASEPRKRIPLLVAACADLRSEIGDLRLVLSRPRGDELAGLDLTGVELRDLDSRAALVDAYSEAWVTVLPSREEAFGLVLAESLACGTRVIGSDEGGIPEVIGDDSGVGRAFEPDDREDLVAALGELLRADVTDDVRARCRAQAQRHDLRRTVAEHLRLYDELLSARG